jgi:endonuclease YncB( thermonuclease family)
VLQAAVRVRTFARDHPRLGVAMLAVVVLVAIGSGGSLLRSNPVKPGPAAVPSTSPSVALPSAGRRIGPFRVLRVVDGATLVVEENRGRARTVRLLGVDAPVLADLGLQSNCLAAGATRALASLVRDGRVSLVVDTPPAIGDRPFGQDRPGDEVRQLAYVYVDQLLVNQALLVGGFVDQYAERPYRLESEFRAAEATARQKGLGVWAPERCAAG